MATQIFIDNREHGLIPHFKLDPTQVLPLEVGDVLFKWDQRIVCIVERKTLEDLQSSINDGRYKEQKLRLLQTREETGCTLVYVVEGGKGKGGGSFSQLNPGMVGAILNTCFRDKIFILQTDSINDTVSALKGMLLRFSEKPETYFSVDGWGTELTKAAHTSALINTKRKGNIDGMTCFLMQLASIPNISMKKATSIADAFGVRCMGAFVAALNCLDEKAQIKRLKEVDGVGGILAKSIVSHVFG